jgi:hypothetical protein
MTNRSTMGGNVFKSDGKPFNWADGVALSNRYDLLNQTINCCASIISIRLENLAATTDHYFLLDIPEGKNLALFNRQLVVSEGRYLVDAVSVDAINLTGANLGVTAPLNKVSGLTVTTELKHVAGGATNPVVREFGFIDTGTAIGAGRAGGTSSVEGVVKILSGLSPLRVRKTNTGAFSANLVFIAWEYDA